MTAIVRLLLTCAMASIVLTMLWAAACGPADLADDDLWPDQEWSGR